MSIEGESASKEHSPERPFCRAARFEAEAAAGTAYFAVQEAIARATADISAYRFLVARRWHVASVADQAPPVPLQQVLEEILKTGQPVELPVEVLTTLLNRHRQVMRHRLPWAEGHYHPGRRPE